jgi:small-conductance mechanosensitive channel
MVAKFRYLTVRTAVASVALVLLVGLLGYLLQFVLGGQLPELYADVIITLVLLVAPFGVTYLLRNALSLLVDAEALTPHQREVLYRFTQLFTFSGVLLIIVFYVWEVAVADVLLGAGLTSIVLALAARQTLSSILSGVIIMSTDVFRVGDWVKIDNRFGKIEQISLFNTMVGSPQGEMHVFPNDQITSRDITNLGKGKYRNDVLVGVDYETDIEHAIGVCDAVLEELTAVEDNHVDGFHPTTVKDFDDSQITLAVKMWVAEPRPMAINDAQTTVFAHLQRAFDADQITIPFPQRTISDRQ